MAPRVVPSPLPQRIVEIDTARTLLEHHTTVILVGGGGVPVTNSPHGLTGIDAVVDKDHVATTLEGDLLVLLTDVTSVMTDYGTAQQHLIRGATVDDLDAMTFPLGPWDRKRPQRADSFRRPGAEPRSAC